MNDSHSPLRQVAESLKTAKRVFLAPHVNIDGDDLGSMIALSSALEQMGIEVVCLSHDPIPDTFISFKGADRFVYSLPDGNFDRAILMECVSLSRLPNSFSGLKRAEKIINLDHHKGNSLNADISWVDDGAAALGEMIFFLINELGASIDRDMASALYFAIASDTGGFKYSNVSAVSHEIASILISKGADAYGCMKRLFLSNSLSFMKLTGELMTSVKSLSGGKLLYSFLPSSLLLKYNLQKKDLNNLIENLNVVEGCKVFCLFVEMPDSTVSVSLRSSDISFPVRKYAVFYGGGGHELACGCSLSGHGQVCELLDRIKEDINIKSL